MILNVHSISGFQLLTDMTFRGNIDTQEMTLFNMYYFPLAIHYCNCVYTLYHS